MAFGMGSSFAKKTPIPAKEVDPGDLSPSPVKKGKKERDPGPLARAIAMSKRARQSTYKNG